MPSLTGELKAVVLGAGTMGTGIAQVAATAGHEVVLIDTAGVALKKSKAGHARIFARLVEKGRLTADEARTIQDRISYQPSFTLAKGAGFVIDAVVEDLAVKQNLFVQVERLLAENALLATNTSSLSVTAIASACDRPERVVGVHFFNPAPLMPLVEIVPGFATSAEVVDQTRALVDGWGKVTVLAKDTPGFIVNRVARPFYGEALRILDEGGADVPTIDWAMKELGGFRMGPFELMDLIGNDINYAVTASVYEAFYYDPRYRPSFTQKRMVEAGRLGRKTGRGYYTYAEDGSVAGEDEPSKDPELGQQIVDRVVAMLINEAVDAVFWQVATVGDIEIAMTTGVNYPKGLLQWADEIGLAVVLDRLQSLQERFGEDRYRPSPLLRTMVSQRRRFHE